MYDSTLTDRIIEVSLDDKSYKICVGLGLLERSGSLLMPFFRRHFTVIVGDETVMKTHFPILSSSLRSCGFEVHGISVPSGEKSKSFSQLERICRHLLELRIERGDIVIALGGGVVGDLVGFAASILLRGVGVIQCPTTLLAQVDSSIGGKTGINAHSGKNLIGTFHQPVFVLCDMCVLETLPLRELRAGYAEIAKYGLLGDEDFFIWLEENYASVLGSNGASRLYAIEKSCLAKADIVRRDAYECGVRSLLNLGHTFAHALEAATAYGDVLLHGEAVSIGIVLAFRLSSHLGLCSSSAADRVEDHFRCAGLPVCLGDIAMTLPDGEELFSFMRQDKKSVDGCVRFILAHGIGSAFICDDIAPSLVIDFLNDSLAV